MKCIVIAGGYGERLWPLSRKNCPKQFIELEKNHSIFQDTIARNMPYCDEFIIVSNYKYRFIIENQLEPFQGLNYRCIFEKQPLKTTAAITLACLSLQPSEYVFVVPTNKMIESDKYKEAVLRAKEFAKSGSIALFVHKDNEADDRYGYVIELDNNSIRKYIEKPKKKIKNVYRNLGFMLFENGIFLNELNEKYVSECSTAYRERSLENVNAIYENKYITHIPIEKALLEKCNHLKAVEIEFEFKEIRTLEDLSGITQNGLVVKEKSDNTKVINTSRKAVVVNNVDDLIVVNTDDALYIGNDGVGLREILQRKELKPYADESSFFHRSWGSYENLIDEHDYRVRRIILNPGKTIYEHSHKKRTENWLIVKGIAKIILDGKNESYHENQSVTADLNVKHQISNIGDIPLVLIETATGEIVHDMVSTEAKNINEYELGIKAEPLIKLKPALKDYLWGGTTLKKKYGIETDMDIVAEAWELSAHPDGESIVASGRHKGLKFSQYIERVGKEVLGWKCSPLQKFPLLIKFIDAKGDLSIQVHPDDDYALEHENQYGKNEMWYVIDSKPGAGLYVGFNKNITKKEVKERVENNTITEVLNFYPTKAGDVFFIPAGTVHAISKGNLICEVQQSSNCTYRLYDYDRKDKYGNKRELHLEKALDILDYSKYENIDKSISCKYFEVDFIKVETKRKIRITEDKFISLVCIEGNGIFSIDNYEMSVKAGDSIFIPACSKFLKIIGKMLLVKSCI